MPPEQGADARQARQPRAPVCRSRRRAIGFGVTALAALGERERAPEWRKRALLVDPDNATRVYTLARAMVLLKERHQALDLLERFAIGHTPGAGLVKWWEVDSDLNPLRDDPRFKTWLADMNDRAASKARGVMATLRGAPSACRRKATSRSDSSDIRVPARCGNRWC